MGQKNYRFETLQLHVGQENPDSATDARAVPIYQTTSYVFRDCAQAAGRFGLSEGGNIYGRLTNPTQGVLENRVAALEGGSAGLAVSSGAAAVTYTIQALAKAGDHIVSQNTIYGGSYNLFNTTLREFGVDTTFVNVHDLEEVRKAVLPNTKMCIRDRGRTVRPVWQKVDAGQSLRLCVCDYASHGTGGQCLSVFSASSDAGLF